jgi:hypothetical protein
LRNQGHHFGRRADNFHKVFEELYRIQRAGFAAAIMFTVLRQSNPEVEAYICRPLVKRAWSARRHSANFCVALLGAQQFFVDGKAMEILVGAPTISTEISNALPIRYKVQV